ncbi:MAG: cupin domain-containing protein [Gammaproteobacteria bacterium]
MEGLRKIHFLNDNARRHNKSLGDATGLSNLGFHLIEVEPGRETTEMHVHYFEEECVYVLEGEAEATIGTQTHIVRAGDFIAYPAGGDAHSMRAIGETTLRCIVAGQRLDHDVADYPRRGKRLFRNTGQEWNMVDIDAIDTPSGGRKA